MSNEAPPSESTPASSPSATGDDVSFVYDVPVTLHVQLGDATLTIGDVLKCGKGSIIPLNQKVGDPFLILLQGKPLAQGEIVEAGENLGIKVTNILKASTDAQSTRAKETEGDTHAKT